MKKPRRDPAPAGRNIELAKIHMAAAALKLIKKCDDSGYRDMLWSIARVRSAKDLDDAGRERVLDHLKFCGWKEPKGRPPAKRKSRPLPQPGLILHLWESLGRAGHLSDASEGALRAWVKRQSATFHPDGTGYDAPQLLPDLVAQRLIEQLKKWCKRLKVSWR